MEKHIIEINLGTNYNHNLKQEIIPLIYLHYNK